MIGIIRRTSVIECTGCCPATQAGDVLFVCQEFSVDHSDGQILRGFEVFHYFPLSSVLYIMTMYGGLDARCQRKIRREGTLIGGSYRYVAASAPYVTSNPASYKPTL